MLSLVVPFYNEEDRISKTYKQLTAYISKNFSDYELIFVNDGSVDNGERFLRRQVKTDKKARLISYRKNRGRGYAVKRGWQEAEGEILGYIDSDLDIKPRYIRECANKIPEYDGAVVSKHISGAKVHTTLLRKLASKVFNFWVGLVLGSKASDHQAGLKIFKKSALKEVLPRIKSEGWLFDVELLYYMQIAGFKIAEVPIHITYGLSKVKGYFIKDFLKAFFLIWEIRNRQKRNEQ